MTGPTMGDADRRAIVWDTIERMAFRPASNEDRNTWLQIFARSLPAFWEMEPQNVQVHPRGSDSDSTTVVVRFHDIECNWSMKRRESARGAPNEYGYSVTLLKESTAFWHLHVDWKYLSGSAGACVSAKYPHQDKDKCLEGDIEEVLDGMLFHPRNHAHAEDLGIRFSADLPSLLLPTHEVRLGGGIENAFVFLAHFRFQFCLLSEDVRKEERRRLNRLFLDAFRGKRSSVSPKELLNLRPGDYPPTRTA